MISSKTSQDINKKLLLIYIQLLKMIRRKLIAGRKCSRCGSTESTLWRHNGTLCNKCYRKQWYVEHREQYLEQMKQYRIKQLELNPDYDRTRRLLYRDYKLHYDKVWHLEHREEQLEQMKVWHYAHPDYNKVRYLERLAT